MTFRFWISAARITVCRCTLEDEEGFEYMLSTYRRRRGGTALTTVKWIIKFFRSLVMTAD